MGKKVPFIFVALCMALCLVPSLGLLARPTSPPIGNERPAELPTTTNPDGTPNLDFMRQMGEWFEKSFAFRPEVITADARVQAGLFGVSNIPTVVVGNDDWLFYASTVDDFLGRNTLSQLQVDGIVHNLELVQREVEAQGARFLFTVAPNKNTLYPQFMPYYYGAQASPVHTRDLLGLSLSRSRVNYCDLFEVLEGRDEVLYMARDSHWSNKGARIAYNALMGQLRQPHDTFDAVQPQERTDFVGDLDKMIFPADPTPEANWYYGAEERYSYVGDATSVEDPRVTAHCDTGRGTLYMYRDSFGNALLPFMATAYGDAVFTKAFPVSLTRDMQMYAPDTVVFEIAERNVSWFVTKPPLMLAPQVELEVGEEQVAPGGAQLLDVKAGTSQLATQFVEVSGTIDYGEVAGKRPVVYVQLTTPDGSSATYECFDLLSEQGADGFVAYVDAGAYGVGTQLTVSVIVSDGAHAAPIATRTISIEGDHEAY